MVDEIINPSAESDGVIKTGTTFVATLGGFYRGFCAPNGFWTELSGPPIPTPVVGRRNWRWNLRPFNKFHWYTEAWILKFSDLFYHIYVVLGC